MLPYGLTDDAGNPIGSTEIVPDLSQVENLVEKGVHKLLGDEVDDSNPASDASVLLTLFTTSSKLDKLSEGTLKGFPYHLLISQPLDVTSTDHPVDTGLEPGRIMLVLDLPVASPAHIAGFGLQDEAFAAALFASRAASHLHSVNLEGDFPDYFHIFADPEHEIELREILSPDTMQYLVDSCGDLQWELFGKNLFFAQTNAPTNSETPSAGIVTGAEQFLARIMPTLQQLNRAQEPQA